MQHYFHKIFAWNPLQICIIYFIIYLIILPKHDSTCTTCSMVVNISLWLTYWSHLILFVPFHSYHTCSFLTDSFTPNDRTAARRFAITGAIEVFRRTRSTKKHSFFRYILFPSMSCQRILCIRVLWGTVNLLVWARKTRELLCVSTALTTRRPHRKTVLMWIQLLNLS